MSNALSKMSDEEICKECKRAIPDRCPGCHQFMQAHPPNDEDLRSACGQELSEDEDDDFKGHAFEKQKDGTQRAVCKWCERPYAACPKCERDFDSDEDKTDDTDDSNDDSEEEADKEPQTGKGRRRRRHGNYF
jgi:hypothetical protein